MRITIPPKWLVATTLIAVGVIAGLTLHEEKSAVAGPVEHLFTQKIIARDGGRFGPSGAFTFELFRRGTFLIDGFSGYAWQKSDNYADSAIIRSTDPLPPTYIISVTVGEIEYDLQNLIGVDVKSTGDEENPQNENGCYLVAITDEAPTGHYTNDWWHKHRKLVIDVDNNIWGSGMPNPIFMVYFDRQNKLMAFDESGRWTPAWKRAVRYEKGAWYTVEIEKTSTHYRLSVYNQSGRLLSEGSVQREKVWHSESHPEYFVVGDPHENYYQGSFKIYAIRLLKTSS